VDGALRKKREEGKKIRQNLLNMKKE